MCINIYIYRERFNVFKNTFFYNKKRGESIILINFNHIFEIVLCIYITLKLLVSILYLYK